MLNPQCLLCLVLLIHLFLILGLNTATYINTSEHLLIENGVLSNFVFVGLFVFFFWALLGQKISERKSFGQNQRNKRPG